MTRDEILAMQPGPELDTEIAVKLFAWSGVREVRPLEFLRTGVGHYEELPKFSASWGYMRLVVEAMAAKGYWLLLKSPFRAGEPYFAGFTPHNETGWDEADFKASGDDAPHAVAVAALLALEGEHA